MTHLKQCTHCGRWLERWRFYRLARGGTRADCTDCVRRAAIERQRRHRAKAT